MLCIADFALEEMGQMNNFRSGTGLYERGKHVRKAI